MEGSPPSQMERRERLRKLLADMDEERVLAAMDAVEPQDQQQQQFVPSTTFYTEGGQALLEARLAVRASYQQQLVVCHALH